MRTGLDDAIYSNRRDFIKKIGTGIVALATGIGLSGCLKFDGEGGDKPAKLAEPGKYVIRKANEMYPVSDIPDAEEEIKKFEDWAINESAGRPLYAISAMPYSVKHNINQNGTMTPNPTQMSMDGTEYPFDTNAVTMDMIMQYLDGKIDESKFSALFDSESVADIVMMKKKGLTVDKYNVTEGRETGSDDVKYLINTYQTKPDASNQVLTGYMHLKLEKKGTKWAPSKVVESEVYTPTGELGFYYVGRKTGGINDIAFHAWVEKANDIPMITDAMENLGLTVDQFVRKVYGDEAVPNGNIVKHYNGGKVILMGGPGGTREFQMSSGDYRIDFTMDEDSPKIFDEIMARTSAVNENGYEIHPDIIVLTESYSNGKPQGFAWMIQKNSPKTGNLLMKIKDGFLPQSTEPADGNIDWV